MFFRVLLVICALATYARAGWIEDRGGKTIIHVSLFYLPDPSRTDAPTRADTEVIARFREKFPELFAAHFAEKAKAHPELYGRHNWDHVEVELKQYSGIQVEGVESDLLAIAGGVAPDVMYINFRKSDTYIQRGFLHPLDRPEDGYVASMTPAEKDARVFPKIWPVIERKGPGGKHVWALPYGGALGRALVYRKDLFDAAGVAYPNKDWTWNDLLSACRKLSDPSRGIYGMYFGSGRDESYNWVTFLWSAGGEVQTYDEAHDEWKIAFDSEAGVEALDFYTKLTAEPWTDASGRRRYGYAARDWRESQVKWERGEIAMNLQYVDEKLFSQINPDLTGMAPVPKGPTGLRGSELNSRMMGLYSGIAEPAVRDAAWEYMRYFESDEAVGIRTRILVEGGFGQFINPKYLEKYGYGEIVRLAPPGWADTFRLAMENGHPEPYGRHSNIAYFLMTDPIHAAQQLRISGDWPADPAAQREVLRGLLKAAGEKARREMLGIVPPAEQQRRRVTGALFLVAAFLGFAGVNGLLVRSFRGASAGPVRRMGWAYLLLAPAVLTVLVWQYVPLLRGSLMAFQDVRLLGESRWVGLDNFGAVLWDADWWRAVWNSLRYSTLVIALTFLPPVVLAILLQEVPRGKVFFRTLFYLPAVMTSLVVILLWKSFYEANERGVLNAMLMKVPAIVFLLIGAGFFALMFAFARRLWFHGRRLPAALFTFAGAALFYACYGLAEPMLPHLFATMPEPIRWLEDEKTAMLSCIIPMVWAGIGPGSLVYLAALKSVPDDLYEAADLDGATFVDKVLFVIFPILKPLLVINFVGVFIGAILHASGNVLAMTAGLADTEVADLHIFYEAFMFMRFGTATAMAWVLGTLLIGFTAFQLRKLARMEFRAAGGDS